MIIVNTTENISQYFTSSVVAQASQWLYIGTKYSHILLQITN